MVRTAGKRRLLLWPRRRTRIGKSLAIWTRGWPVKKAPERLVPRESDRPRRSELIGTTGHSEVRWPLIPAGPHRLSAEQLPKEGVWVSYHYGFSADIGGGEYDRPLSQPGRQCLSFG